MPLAQRRQAVANVFSTELPIACDLDLTQFAFCHEQMNLAINNRLFRQADLTNPISAPSVNLLQMNDGSL